MSDKRVLVSFGRSDPLRLTEALHETGLHAKYIWGPDFGRPKPDWADYDYALMYLDDDCKHPLFEAFHDCVDMVYTGHGATLLEATAAGCEILVLRQIEYAHLAIEVPGGLYPQHINVAEKIEFIPAWTGVHLDHSGREVRWWEPGILAAMAKEIKDRRSK